MGSGEPERRLGLFLRTAVTPALGRGSPHLHRLADRIGIEHGDRRAAVGTRRVLLEVDRATAPGAFDLLDLDTQLPDFPRRQLADELLLPQKMVERRQASVRLAAIVGNPPGDTDVMGELQPRLATWAGQGICQRQARLVRTCIDDLEQLHNRAGRQLGAFRMVEPDDKALDANIDVDLPDGAALDGDGLHFLRATRAVCAVMVTV